ncbi:hypothetical protein FHS15_001547 [Paenibacillus castaneae]|uniref:hypothetical protein n=1 Tax=Paenibacillus castaneae TaxID=474957 RepID=UPI000C9CFA38|nr:hypothetical protein [Paenibacillus castaneae]NIK76422.1 hypothetical protein [Paenibacillus castaneae]
MRTMFIGVILFFYNGMQLHTLEKTTEDEILESLISSHPDFYMLYAVPYGSKGYQLEDYGVYNIDDSERVDVM